MDLTIKGVPYLLLLEYVINTEGDEFKGQS